MINTILGVPCHNYSIIGPTLYSKCLGPYFLLILDDSRHYSRFQALGGYSTGVLF